MGRIIPVAVPFLRRHPRLMAIARSLHFRIWYLRVRINARLLSENLDVNRTYWVNPDN